MSKHRNIALNALMLCAGLAVGAPAHADVITSADQKMLTDLKFDAGALKGIDDEVRVPQGWLDAAKKEGAVILYDTIRPKEWDKIYSVFSARYPDVKIDHQEVNTSTRRYVLPLTAFKQGRYIVDVITGLSGNGFLFREANALEDLSVLPNYKFVPSYARQPDGITIASRIQYWCMSYNTQLAKPEDMPKTWEDLVDSKRFSDKKLMIGNRPNDWLLYLWDTNGEEWGKAYVQKIFDNLHPQLRKESLNAIVKLTALGEGEIAVPQAMNKVGDAVREGSPVGYHCPEPVPLVLTEMAIMKNSPHVNGAKIFANWFISKEGQIAQFWANASTPAREDMRGKQFLDFPEAVEGKKVMTLHPNSKQTSVDLSEYWDKMWQSAGGASAK
jgi:iron(III) transport system substrate-binding protein